MRRDPDGAIVLSRRNLLALLAKLDQPGSARTIMGGMACEGVEGLMIRSEDDAAHYADRSKVGYEVVTGQITFRVSRHNSPQDTEDERKIMELARTLQLIFESPKYRDVVRSWDLPEFDVEDEPYDEGFAREDADAALRWDKRLLDALDVTLPEPKCKRCRDTGLVSGMGKSINCPDCRPGRGEQS